MKYIPLNLQDLREQRQNQLQKVPFPCQGDAIRELQKCFTFRDDQTKGALLVLPTGAGKTFTAVKWLCDQVLPKRETLNVRLESLSRVAAKQSCIVLFVDKWKQLVNWATPSMEGGDGDSRQVRGRYPLEYISIRLVEELVRQINLPGPKPRSFLQTMPVGWYQTDFTVNTSEDNFDEMTSFTEFIMVYEHTKPKFEKFMDAISDNLTDEWSKEYLADVCIIHLRSEINMTLISWQLRYYRKG